MPNNHPSKTVTYEKQLSKFFDERNGNRIEWCHCGYPCEVRGTLTNKYECLVCKLEGIIEKLSTTIKELRDGDFSDEV